MVSATTGGSGGVTAVGGAGVGVVGGACAGDGVRNGPCPIIGAALTDASKYVAPAFTSTSNFGVNVRPHL
jgi:hypothetical protein